MKSEQYDPAVLGPVERQVRPGAEARPLVERLRSGVYGTNRIPLCDEAANEIERLHAALADLLAFDLENDGATCDWPELQVAIKAARGLGPNV